MQQRGLIITGIKQKNCSNAFNCSILDVESDLYWALPGFDRFLRLGLDLDVLSLLEVEMFLISSSSLESLSLNLSSGKNSGSLSEFSSPDPSAWKQSNRVGQ